MKTNWIRWRPQGLALLAILLGLSGLGFLLLPAADHRDGPVFGPPGITDPGGAVRSPRDFNDIYVFRSPTNANNTVLVADLSPFSTVNTPAIFDHRATYLIHIINRDLLLATDDITLKVNFLAPDINGVQKVFLRGNPVTKFKRPTAADPNPDPILAQGKTGQNIALDSQVGGMFRAAEQDDPFFFDATGFARLINPPAADPLPRPPGTATNFFGGNAAAGMATNTLSIVIEIPSRFLTRQGNNVIGVWASIKVNGVQVDRMGRPAISSAIIPPIPRGSNNPIDNSAPNRFERRNAFNAAHPRNDRRDFKADAVSVLQNFYGRNATDASNIADALLPDILVFDVTSTEGFGTTIAGMLGNGRRLRDDVIDTELGILTGGGITTDNVNDDNLGSPTNAVNPIQANFPYIRANAFPTGLPREGVPAPAQ